MGLRRGVERAREPAPAGSLKCDSPLRQSRYVRLARKALMPYEIVRTRPDFCTENSLLRSVIHRDLLAISLVAFKLLCNSESLPIAQCSSFFSETSPPLYQQHFTLILIAI